MSKEYGVTKFESKRFSFERVQEITMYREKEKKLEKVNIKKSEEELKKQSSMFFDGE